MRCVKSLLSVIDLARYSLLLQKVKSFTLKSFRLWTQFAYWALRTIFNYQGHLSMKNTFLDVFSYKLAHRWAAVVWWGGSHLKSALFITQEVLIKFMVLKTPTYQLHWRTGQAIVNMNHQSISHFNEMKQINCFLQRCLSDLLFQVLRSLIKFSIIKCWTMDCKSNFLGLLKGHFAANMLVFAFILLDLNRVTHTHTNIHKPVLILLHIILESAKNFGT